MIAINHNRGEVTLQEICYYHYILVHKKVLKKMKNLPMRASLRNYFTENHGSRVREVITAVPGEFTRIENELEEFCANRRINNYKSKIRRIFSYDNFSRRRNYNPYNLAKALDIKICPYCNRKYTYTVIIDGARVIRPEFDHFYNESNHPLFAISFYNLVPSCSDCNRIKGAKQFDATTHVHPYIESFGQHAKFNYMPRDYETAIGDSNNLSIDLECDNAPIVDRILRNKADLNIDSIYSAGHSSEVADIIKKHYITNGDFLQSLQEAIPEIGSLEELYKIAFGNYMNPGDFEKRPLAKLTYDIVESMGFLEGLI